MTDREELLGKWLDGVYDAIESGEMAAPFVEQQCPLCACFERIEELESALRAAADSLGTLAVASRQNGFEDLIDVRGYANSRWTVACELLPETKCRCSRCGCLPARHRRDDEELRECLDCECTRGRARGRPGHQGARVRQMISRERIVGETTSLSNAKCEEQPDHSPDCGTKYRGCAPDCEFDKADVETSDLIHDLRRRAETAEARVRELEAKLGDYLDHVCARDAAVIVRPPEDA